MGGLTAAAVAVVVLDEALTTPSAPGTAMDLVAPNFVYPFIDVALLALAGGCSRHARLDFAGSRDAVDRHPGFAVVDCVFLYQVTEGSPPRERAGRTVSDGNGTDRALGVALEDDRAGRPPEGVIGLLVPVGLALVCVSMLLYEATNRAPSAARFWQLAGSWSRSSAATSPSPATGWRHVRSSRRNSWSLLRFRALVEATMDFVAIADLHGRLVYMNPGGRRLVGLEPGVDVTATQVADYLTDEGLRVCRRCGCRRWWPRSTGRGVTLRDQRGGLPIPVAVSTFEIRHPGTGEPWLIATVQKDLTERVAAESAMRDLADQRRLLLGHLVAAQETERSRIAADVHDDSVQALAAVD